MSLADSDLGSLGNLGRAIGLTTGSGTNSAWFEDPLGQHTNQHGLKSVLSDPDQRNALLDFVDEVLGPPPGRTVGDTRWIPLFQNAHPTITIHAVVQTLPGSVRVGVGLDHTTGTAAPYISSRVHVPLVHLPNGSTDSRPDGGTDPDWLLIGHQGGVIEIELDARFTDDAPVPREAHLGGAQLRLGVPTSDADDLEFGLSLVDLQLPGAASPSTQRLDVDSIAELGSDVFEFIVGLIRAQAAALDLTDDTFRHIAGLTGILGLREADGVPTLPLADLPARGPAVLVEWIEQVLNDDTARDAWLAELARLVGGTARPDLDAVDVALGDVHLTLGVRVAPGTGGHPVLTPWAEVGYDTRTGVRVGGGLDLLRIDTAHGTVKAVPQLRAVAVFGADASLGAARLVATGPVQIGSVHLGVALDDLDRPAFVLTLHDVDISAGGQPRHHDLLDLSSPDAALDALDSAIDDAISSALDGLGTAGTLIKQLLGIDPPGAIDDVGLVDLVSDPIAAIRSYYRALMGDSTAMAEVLGTLRALLTASPISPVPGLGTSAVPWRLTFATTGGGAGLGLAVWTDHGHLLIAAAADLRTDVFDDLAVASDLRIVLIDADLDGGHLALAPEGHARLQLVPRGDDPATVSLGVATLEFAGAGVQVGWRAGRGFAVGVVGDGLALAFHDIGGIGPGGATVAGTPMRVDLPLPHVEPNGSITWAPDWDDIEAALGRLLAAAHVPVIDSLVDLLGWNASLSLQLSGVVGARLSLAGLFADPGAAIARWAADAALDCDHLQAALGVLATVLSGGSLHAPLGRGTRELPYRTPIAGVAAAPGIFAWTDPPCPPRVPFSGGPFDLFDGVQFAADDGDASLVGEQITEALRRASTAIPGLGDLLVARTHLGDGFDQLVTRWTGTDGVTGPTGALPSDVAQLVLPGYGYAELAALGRSSTELLDELGIDHTAVVHVGCDDGWGQGHPLGECIDATGGAPGNQPPSATLPASAAGQWFVRIPTPAAAALGRPDHDGVAGQTAHLLEAIATRTGPVVVVAYGAAGAAGVRAATGTAAVSAVVTVGTPWSPVSVTGLQTGQGGDALSLLSRLAPTFGPDDWPDELRAQQTSALARGADLVARGTAVRGPADLPSAGAETRRSGLVAAAVFGVLAARDAVGALAAVVTNAVLERGAAADAAALAAVGRPEHLHIGVDVPAFDADIGGVTIGAGASFELLHVARGVGPALPTVEVARELTVDLDLGVTDGWLVGGPGATTRDIEVRWVQARVHVPLSLDGQPAAAGWTEIVLHEARALGATCERWVIRADGAITVSGTLDQVTTALPEVKVILGEVMGRIHTAVPALSSLFTSLGLMRTGGLDPDGLDRLLFDPGATLRPLFAAHPADLALAINTLTGAATDPLRPATAIDLGGADGHLRVDLATRTIAGSANVTLPGMPVVELAVEAAPTHAGARLSVGSIDPADGGLALDVAAVHSTNPLDPHGVTVALRHRRPADPADASATTTLAVFPTADVPALRRFAATVVPSALIQAVLTYGRDHAGADGRSALDAGLEAVGLLGAATDSGVRHVVLPVGLLTDPGAWLTRRADPLAAAVAVLDALAPVVAPARGNQPGWPIDPAFGITYGVVAGRLQLAAHLHVGDTLDGAAIAVDVTAGLAISTSAAPQPVVDAAATVDGWGLRLQAASGIALDLLRPTPQTAIALYPAGPGLGTVIADVGTSLVPVALNALAAHRDDHDDSLAQHVGAAIHEIGEAMGLLDGPVNARQFSGALIATFADHPGQALLDHLPALAGAGLAALATALDPTHSIVSTSVPSTNVRRFAFGTGHHIHIDLDGSPTAPAIELGGTFDLKGSGPQVFGVVALEKLRLSATGVHVDVRVGPVAVDLGAMTLYPVVVVRAGAGSGADGRLVGLGLGLDPAGSTSVEFRWALNGDSPYLATVTRPSGNEHEDKNIAKVALNLVGVAVSLASGILADALHDVIPDDATARLQGVVFTGGDRTLDPGLVTDLLDPGALLQRLYQLAWNCATGTPLTFTIDHTVTIGLANLVSGPNTLVGLSVSLDPGKKVAIAQGSVNVDLEVDAGWVEPHVTPGLGIYVLKGTGPNDLAIDFGVSVAGLGLRFTKTGGPLLDLGGISLDGIAVHLYGEASSLGVGGGARLQLSGLAVAPGGQGDGKKNGMANSLVNDAGAAGKNNRPSFSPSLAVQKHPGLSTTVGFRAGDPPGPWWVVIQRQLGPIYVDRIGLDTVETNGSVTRISLLFNGSVSLFGLTAAVEQLSLNWEGGDVLSIQSWSADLMGLAVSADMAGVSLTGGLLKSVDADGVVSYVGMLVGRFATYGLSVFGGYASDPHGHASFFVFGAVTGPIGGPPAFFLTGLGGGLGINRGLVIPDDVSKFPTYPFIMALDPAATPPADPMGYLHELNVYFPHQPGNFWFAAGISFTCFALVDGIAVVAVSFGDGLEINLLGLARMALPRPQAPLVSIELALLARFSTKEGVFMIKAQLTDNSWILYQDIRLTGGFAFAIWWKGPLAGQFVITMGGYHPDFHHDGYPEVPRLGLVWKISDAIVMKGESYFALTSEALMAGTGVSVSVDFGWVWAKIEFGADGIIYFDPFFFDVSAYCRISAGIDIDLGLFELSLSITIGATIHVWGPEFAGKVTFEIGPCEVPISFGPSAQNKGRTIDWPAFVTKYLEDAGGGTARAISSITGRGTLPTSTKGEQGAPSADGSEALPFQVFAEFEITFTTTVPTPNFEIGVTPASVPVVLSNGANGSMGLAPMGAGNLSSTMVVSLQRWTGSTWAPVPELALLAKNLTEATPKPDLSRISTGAFPTGVWGLTKSLDPPVKPPPSGDVLVTGNQLTLVADVQKLTTGPEINFYTVEHGRRPLPLHVAGAARVELLQAAAALPAVNPGSAAEALSIAQRVLFSPTADDSRGATTTALGRRAYAYDRVAPPRFANLTDGLASSNGANGEREPMAPAPTREVPQVRSPFVAGYFASGVGAAARPPATTVADGRLKRRTAPSTDSVRGRLGLHLPAVLQQSAPPAVQRDRVLSATLSVPRTDVLGAVRAISTGPVGRLPLNGIVGGLTGAAPRSAPARGRGRRPQPRADAVPDRIATGDVVVLQQPDARIDTAATRPSIAVSGRARVVLLAPHGVVHDDDLVDARLTIPAGTSLIGIQADGDADALDGYSGWHDRSRLGLLSERAAIGAGCTVVVDGHGSNVGFGWSTGNQLVLNAAEVHTRFSRTMRTIAVALTGVAPRSLLSTEVHVIGARLARDRQGVEKPPVVVTLGQTSVLVYGVVPDRGATSITVTVTPGSDWVVSGVLGAGGPNEAAVTPTEMAELIARRGLAAVSARLTVMQGDGCRVDWIAPHDAPQATPKAADAPKRRKQR